MLKFAKTSDLDRGHASSVMNMVRRLGVKYIVVNDMLHSFLIVILNY